MDIHIRRTEPHDCNDLAEIYSFESVIEQTSQLPYGSAAFWLNFYASKNTNSIELVAACDNKAVGHLGILLNSNPRRKHAASFGIAVHPHYQSKGVGKALMHSLLDLADNWLNLLKIELSVSTGNEPAIALYKKFDFAIEGKSQCDIFKRGQYSHSYQMARFHPHYFATVLQADT